MKSPEGLIWNTPIRRKAFNREPEYVSQAEIDQIWEEIEAEEARRASDHNDPPVPPRLMLVTPDWARVETSARLGMP